VSDFIFLVNVGPFAFFLNLTWKIELWKDAALYDRSEEEKAQTLRNYCEKFPSPFFWVNRAYGGVHSAGSVAL
jgi:hypothetical protein